MRLRRNIARSRRLEDRPDGLPELRIRCLSELQYRQPVQTLPDAPMNIVWRRHHFKFSNSARESRLECGGVRAAGRYAFDYSRAPGEWMETGFEPAVHHVQSEMQFH